MTLADELRQCHGRPYHERLAVIDRAAFRIEELEGANEEIRALWPTADDPEAIKRLLAVERAAREVVVSVKAHRDAMRSDNQEERAMALGHAERTYDALKAALTPAPAVTGEQR